MFSVGTGEQPAARWLWRIANTATLIGLVRTIIALIRAFENTATLEADQNSIALARGISEAMNNTAFGLSIAVLCILAQLLLTRLGRGAAGGD